VVAGLDAYADQGLREVVLTGIHLGAWGLDLDPPSGLAGLARRLADASRVRLRFSSIEPDELTDELIEISTSSSVFAPSFHLPLQSGSDRILAAMGRPYTAGLFEDLVRMLIGIDPLACIGADVLTGLPGETEEAFEETAALIGRLPLAYLHAFPYSPRPGTRAEKMPDPVDRRTAKDRVRVLRDISRDKTRDFYRRNIGRVRETLIENQPDPATGWARGLTDNYASVLLPRGGPPAGEIVPVRLLEIDGRGRLIGRAD
jgi:threonylcarbamoyladenosine tRNA methylthiotransferase MtaB